MTQTPTSSFGVPTTPSTPSETPAPSTAPAADVSSQEVDQMFSSAEQESTHGEPKQEEAAEPTADEVEPDVPNDRAPAGGEFRWSDIQKAMEFTRVWMEKAAIWRNWLRWTLSMADDASALDFLRMVNNHDDSIFALRQVNDLLTSMQEDTGFMGAIRMANTLNALDHDERKHLYSAVEHVVNFFPKGGQDQWDDISLRYRRNIDDSTFVETVIENLQNIDASEAQPKLQEAAELFAIWS